MTLDMDVLLSSSGESFLADSALQTDRTIEAVLLQHAFDPLVHARLADVVERLAPIRTLVAEVYGNIASKNKSSIRNLEQRVTTPVCQLLLQLSQAICQIEIVLLEGMQLGVVREQTVLCLEQLVVDLAHNRSHLTEVPKAQSSFANLSGCSDGCSGCSNK